MIETTATRGLWSRPNSKTPAAKFYAAVIREIAMKDDAARTKEGEQGQFEYHTHKSA